MKYGIIEIIQDAGNIRDSLKYVYRSGKKEFISRILLIFFQSTLPLALLYFMKLLVDSISGMNLKDNPDGLNGVLVLAGLFCGVFLLIRFTDILKELNDELSSQKLRDYISNLVQEKSAALDIEYYDNPEYHDAFHRAKEEVSFRPVMVLSNLTNIISGIISLSGIIVMLVFFSKSVVLIMILAGLPALFLKFANNRNLYEWRKENTSLYRKSAYYFDVLTKREFAKELRVYNLGKYFGDLFNSIRNKIAGNIRLISVKRSKLFIVSALFETAALAGVIYLLSQKVYAGALTLGSFVMFFEAFRRGQGYVSSVVSGITGLYENKLYLSNLFDFLSLENKIVSSVNPAVFPGKITRGIRFENVSFRYPGSEKFVIENLSFEAKPGEIFRIKGENGSGKTTSMKLLCRLYDCTEGKILIDNVDIKDFDISELRENIGVIFQDFSMYDLTARENIILSSMKAKPVNGKLAKASEIGRADKVINGLKDGYDTILGKYFEHGEELSMGQWQRIALARAVYPDAGILILDEPSSWLDAGAEKEFYENLNSLDEGKIIFLISHNEMTSTESKEFKHLINTNK